MKKNLLEETLKVLEENNLTAADVVWVGSFKIKTDWNNFEEVANIEYNSGFGSFAVAADLFIVGNDWWLERNGFEGKEWWDFKRKPKEPKAKAKLHSVVSNQLLVYPPMIKDLNRGKEAK